MGFGRSRSSYTTHLRQSDPFQHGIIGKTDSDIPTYTFVLSWHSISLTLGDETVLSSLSGKMGSGTVSALITSDSACSRALLETLAARNSAARYKHAYGALDIRINDNLVDVSQYSYRKRVTYLPAGDSILPSKLTVREALVFHAKMSGMPDRSCYKVVSKIISNLRLQLKASTLIEDLNAPERARARVAIALVGRPAALLLESPLDGLDVYEAFQMMAVLKKVAIDLNTAVLISLAQPSSEVLFALDEVNFLIQGASVFSGPPTEIVPYFEQLGYLCPPSYSPSDFLLFLFEVIPDEEEDRLVSAWQWHVGNALDVLVNTPVETPVNITPTLSELKRSTSRRKVGLFSQFKTLYMRDVRLFFRNFNDFLIRLGLLALLTALMSLVMYQIGPTARAVLDTNTVVEDPVSNYYGAVAFMVILAMSGHLEAVTVSIPEIRSLFVAEDAMGSVYGIFVFFLTQISIELPTTFFICTIQLLIGYWTIGFVGSFINWLLVLFLTAVTTSSVGWFIACSTENPLTAVQLIPLVVLPQILFSGLLTDFSLVPTWIDWMEYLCFLKYCINIAFLIEVEMYDSELLKPIETQNNIDPDKTIVYIFTTLAISLLCRIGAVLALLYYRNRGKITNWITTLKPSQHDSEA